MQIAIYGIFLLLGIVLAVVLAIGVMDVVRGTPITSVGSPGEQTCCPATEDPAFREHMELLTHVDLDPGHEIDLFINGDQTYPRLWEDLRGAKTSITLQLYYCNKGRMAEEISGILIERARAGVEVYFLYDAFGTTLDDVYFDKLRAAGVKARPFRPLSFQSLQKAQHRAHIRVVVVDGIIGYTGGFGIDDKWYGTGRQEGQWRDTNVRFTGPAVRQLQATFIVCWAEASGNLLTGEKLLPEATRPEEDSGDRVAAGLLHASPTVGSTSAERFFALSTASAREKIYLSNSYFVPGRAFRTFLCDAAKRGVDVRILTVCGKSDVKSTWYAGRARYEELLGGGVRIFEYQPAMMHAKSLVVDGVWSAVGSMNADNRSMSFNEESNLMMLDPDIGQRMEKIFVEDLEYSEEILLESFKKRGWRPRVAEKACYLVRRVL
ncbi:MAG: phospholipase D-like domain-containing protein, partial [Gemmatimonadaceae bacterium]